MKYLIPIWNIYFYILNIIQYTYNDHYDIKLSLHIWLPTRICIHISYSISIGGLVNVQAFKTHNAHNPFYIWSLCLLSWKTQISRSIPYLELCFMSFVDATWPCFLICCVWQPLIVLLPYLRQDVSLKIEQTRVIHQNSFHVLKLCHETPIHLPTSSLYGTKPFIRKPTCAPTFRKGTLPIQMCHMPSKTLDRLAFIRKSTAYVIGCSFFVWMASIPGK